MSYDIYCYKSELGKPDVEEARSLIEVDEERLVPARTELKESIANALIEFDPTLEKFEFDYEVIAKQRNITLDEAKIQYSHIELNTQLDALSVQIEIFDNNVAISTPYWYSGDEAKSTFAKIDEYTKVIYRIAEYFVYDPQTDKAFNPLISHLTDISTYTETTEKVRQIGNELRRTPEKKPWWKFW